MDDLRTTEYQSFAKIGLERANTTQEDAYKKIESEKELIKERIKQAGGANRALFHDILNKDDDEDWEDDSDVSDETFYNNSDGEEAVGGKIPGSKPGQPVKAGRISVPIPQ